MERPRSLAWIACRTRGGLRQLFERPPRQEPSRPVASGEPGSAGGHPPPRLERATFERASLAARVAGEQAAGTARSLCLQQPAAGRLARQFDHERGATLQHQFEFARPFPRSTSDQLRHLLERDSGASAEGRQMAVMERRQFERRTARVVGCPAATGGSRDGSCHDPWRGGSDGNSRPCAKGCRRKKNHVHPAAATKPTRRTNAAGEDGSRCFKSPPVRQIALRVARWNSSARRWPRSSRCASKTARSC